MKYKIGVFGSSAGEMDKVIPQAHALGEIIAKQNLILITGASTGLPYEAVLAAHKQGGEIWGYSKATDYEMQQKLLPQCDAALFTKLFYIPKDYSFVTNDKVCLKYRNVTSTANCDAGILISGRWGVLNEFTNLYDMGKVIGVLTNTGGIADELPALTKKISKESKAVVIFNENPEELVKQILVELEKRH